MPKFKIIDKDEIASYFEREFGIERKTFENYVFLSSGKKIWMVEKESWEKIKDELEEMNVQSIGIAIARMGRVIKPTSNFLQIFGKYAKRKIVELDEKEALDYIKGLDIKKDCKEKGYVIVKFGEDVLGCGLAKEGWIKNQIPKARRVKKL